MSMTIKKLPAILLAVIITAALILAMGLSQQTAYADTAQKDLAQKLAQKQAAVGSEYTIILDAEGFGYKTLPNSTVNLDATVYDAQFNDVTNQVPALGMNWEVTVGSDVAIVNGSGAKATVTFADMPLGETEKDVTVVMKATINGQAYESFPLTLTMCKDYDALVATPIDEYLAKGETATVTAKVLNYSEEHPEGVPYENVNYKWEGYEAEDVEITPATGPGPEFKVTRLSGNIALFWLTAEFTKDGQKMEDTDFFWFSEIAYDLSDYMVEVKNLREDASYYLDSATDTFPLEVEVKLGDFVLDPSEYDLVVDKYWGYDYDTGEEIYKPVEDQKNLGVESDGVLNANYDEVGGTDTYRVRAIAKTGSKYTGEAQTMFNLYDKHTLNGWFNSEVDFGSENLLMIDEYPYFEYEFTPGAIREPEVKIDSKPLPAGAYTLAYLNVDTGDVLNTLPSETGEYLVIAKGVAPYYGENVDSWIKIGKANTTKIKGKSVSVKKGKKATIKKSKAFNIKKACGTLHFYKQSVNGKFDGNGYDKIDVTDKGNVTIKKGLKKGTYKVKVWVSSSGDKTHIGFNKVVTLTIKAK